MRGITSRRRVTRLQDGHRRARDDDVVTEEPLEIRVGGSPAAVTMRTPGSDFELAAGFLLAEGVVRSREDILRIDYCEDAGEHYNVVDVTLRTGVAAPGPVRRYGITSACGVCGSASIEAVRDRAVADVSADALRVAAGVLAAMPERLAAAQRIFERTGGLHAAGLFDGGGELVCAREDVGRHNAFDKVIGSCIMEGRLPLRGHVMLASGRASFELVQKALAAGAPVLAAVSAPSSLAVDLAASCGMTLVGFLRGSTMNLYCGEERVV